MSRRELFFKNCRTATVVIGNGRAAPKGILKEQSGNDLTWALFRPPLLTVSFHYHRYGPVA
jgi:hypothetical protein